MRPIILTRWVFRAQNPLKPGFPVSLIHEGKCYEFAFVSYAADGKHCALAKVTDAGCEYILTDVDLSVVYSSTQKEPTADVFDITPGSTIVKFEEFCENDKNERILATAKYKVGDTVSANLYSNLRSIDGIVVSIEILNGILYYRCRFNPNLYSEPHFLKLTEADFV